MRGRVEKLGGHQWAGKCRRWENGNGETCARMWGTRNLGRERAPLSSQRDASLETEYEPPATATRPTTTTGE